MKLLSKSILILGAVAMLACGDKKEEKEDQITIGDGNSQSQSETTTDKASSEVNASDKDVVEITIEGNDQMRFNKDTLRVKAGQTVRLTLEHVGEMEESIMGHNWVLLKQGTVINEFGQKAVQFKENDYIPTDSEAIITHTELIGGGEQVTIEFEAPAAGVYDYICSFPGHYSVMKGKFIVEE